MYQRTLSDVEYSQRRRLTRRELFLNKMEEIISWEKWVEQLRPFYPSGKKGRPPKDLETMLRMYLLGKWFHLSAAGTEDAIYDSYAMRSFMHLDFFREQVPSETTLLHFRHLVEDQGIDKAVFQEIREKLAAEGKILRKTNCWETTIINYRSQKPRGSL